MCLILLREMRPLISMLVVRTCKETLHLPAEIVELKREFIILPNTNNSPSMENYTIGQHQREEIDNWARRSREMKESKLMKTVKKIIGTSRKSSQVTYRLCPPG